MKHIINQIREVLDKPLGEKGFLFEEKSNSYISVIDDDKELYSSLHFDIRKKKGTDYFLLKISIRIIHYKISEIANNVKIKAIKSREIPKSVINKLTKGVKDNKTIAGLYILKELVDKEIDIWSCSVKDLTEIKDYKEQLMYIFNNAIKWINKCNNWDFLINWTLNHNNALQSLSILKYLRRKQEFEDIKKKAISQYLEQKYPIDELNLI